MLRAEGEQAIKIVGSCGLVLKSVCNIHFKEGLVGWTIGMFYCIIKALKDIKSHFDTPPNNVETEN